MHKLWQEFTCDYCGASECDSTQPLSLAFIPAGWRRLEDKYVCPKHEVVVRDKDAKTWVEKKKPC